jgi:hypothetical protein
MLDPVVLYDKNIRNDHTIAKKEHQLHTITNIAMLHNI